ncbi:Crp/Fnr family transcriptional regulator [Aquimarina sp. 2-A2]|uniref:Crp/Fnr family transcriptional regulator n=1 Tax=Aquimarina sp. 2-A2 TaxID=3382644 RepID=UPI00387EF206
MKSQLNKVLELGYKEVYKKRTHLLREGYSANDLFYIEKGLVRVYYLKGGKEITDWFGTSNTYLTSISGFYQNKKSTQYIETIEDSIIHTIKKSEIEKECMNKPEIERDYRQIIVNHLVRLQERITALQFYSASERYDLLLKKNPYVIKRASRTDIASYLGISLETLSRVSSNVII